MVEGKTAQSTGSNLIGRSRERGRWKKNITLENEKLGKSGKHLPCPALRSVSEAEEPPPVTTARPVSCSSRLATPSSTRRKLSKIKRKKKKKKTGFPSARAPAPAARPLPLGLPLPRLRLAIALHSTGRLDDIEPRSLDESRSRTTSVARLVSDCIYKCIGRFLHSFHIRKRERRIRLLVEVSTFLFYPHPEFRELLTTVTSNTAQVSARLRTNRAGRSRSDKNHCRERSAPQQTQARRTVEGPPLAENTAVTAAQSSS